MMIPQTTRPLVFLFLVLGASSGCDSGKLPSPQPAATRVLWCHDGTTGPCSRLGPSLVQVISQPALFDGRTITTKGYLSLDFEGTAVFASADDYEWSTGTAIYVDLPEDMRMKLQHLNRSWVVVTGTYSAVLAEGYVGRLHSIESIVPAISRTQPNATR